MGNSSSEKTDRTLLAGVEGGCESSANEIFQKYAPSLLAVARNRLSNVLNARVDADDIVQSTFKSFFRQAQSTGYVVPETGDLYNLLIVIAMRKVNAKADYHRAAKRDVRRSGNPMALDLQSTNREDSLRDLLWTLDEICQKLAANQRAIIELRLQGYSVQEIADKVRRSKRTVERELQNFRRLLSQKLETE